MDNPSTAVFLTWLVERLVNVYGESENVDFVHRLRKEAHRAQTLRTNLSANTRTYHLVNVCGDFHDPHDDSDHTCAYALMVNGSTAAIKTELRLTDQQANDLARQLDASVDYFND
jgi:hypothetical protein